MSVQESWQVRLTTHGTWAKNIHSFYQQMTSISVQCSIYNVIVTFDGSDKRASERESNILVEFINLLECTLAAAEAQLSAWPFGFRMFRESFFSVWQG